MSDHDDSLPAAWAAIADLAVVIESLSCEQHSLPGGYMGSRDTTIVALHGAGHVGRGEDVSYGLETQAALPAHLGALPLAGTWTMASLSAHLDTLRICPDVDGWEQWKDYTRWALESAALDLALRQADRTFMDVVGVDAQPMQWMLSMALGSPPDVARVAAWHEQAPELTFKLDASSEWTDSVCAELAAVGGIAVVDLKGHYEGDWFTHAPTAATYAAIIRALPHAVLEDARIDGDFRAAWEAASPAAQLTWDAPVHGIDDVERFRSSARVDAVNIKPSRFGSLRNLFASIEHCQRLGLPMYAGGQTELGIGRTQAQTIAACWYADAGNDLAPAIFHTAQPGDDVSFAPVIVPSAPGFGWDA